MLKEGGGNLLWGKSGGVQGDGVGYSRIDNGLESWVYIDGSTGHRKHNLVPYEC